VGGLLIRLGKWLEERFPKKLTVTLEDWNRRGYELDTAHEEIDILRGELADLKASHAATIDRVGHLEASAVHKGAVSDLVAHVKAQKDELVALKANLGWSNRGAKGAEIEAMLNGEPLSNE
jgi:hypothetical protein